MTATPKIPEARKVPELTLHPLCTLIPPCTEEEFKELKEDIKKNGLQVPIKLFEGKILDGRSRHMARVELEKEFKVLNHPGLHPILKTPS
jgi:ParB-like chromosome segregation protein Spo0J